jgi:hypothetical protein
VKGKVAAEAGLVGDVQQRKPENAFPARSLPARSDTKRAISPSRLVTALVPPAWSLLAFGVLLGAAVPSWRAATILLLPLAFAVVAAWFSMAGGDEFDEYGDGVLASRPGHQRDESAPRWWRRPASGFGRRSLASAVANASSSMGEVHDERGVVLWAPFSLRGHAWPRRQ